MNEAPRYTIEPFEAEVLRIMTKGILSASVLDAAISDHGGAQYNYDGYGYYLDFHHSGAAMERTVCSDPLLVGETEGIIAGFVVFIEGNEITLECFPFDGTSIPESFRTQAVRIRRK